MLDSFIGYIQKQKLFTSKDKILLTVSGGIDSIVLCHLFHQAKSPFAIAHCNFQLRAGESKADEEFVEQLATVYNVPFHSITFKTASYAKKNKISIQMAARELRYNWFEEIKKQFNYKYIATAHHLDDSIETFFINFLRGTGIAGLRGIEPKQGNIVRPLLSFSKQDIIEFASNNNLKFREDSSNASDKYVRNKIRHHLIPLLKEINPQFEKIAAETLANLSGTELVYKEQIEKKRKLLLKKDNEGYSISIKALKKLKTLNTYLYEILKPFDFNFSTVEEIISALDGEAGKQFFSSTHQLIKDRETLLIRELIKKEPKNSTDIKFQIEEKQQTLSIPNLSFTFKTQKLIKAPTFQKDNSTVAIDFDKLVFPLELRRWNKGDSFFPLGMKNKKKLSDFFIDQKLSLFEKENVWLLVSDGKIVWVVGHRLDERFKISGKTRKLYNIFSNQKNKQLKIKDLT